MGLGGGIALIFLCMVMLLDGYINARPAPAGSSPNSNVIDFGAVGDGKTDDSQAFLKAWEATCESTSKDSATLVIPGAKTFLLKPVEFQGPCNPHLINVQILGDIIAPIQRDFGSSDNWLTFSKVDGLIVNGNGQIDGNGPSWWALCKEGTECRGPAALTFNKCNNLQYNGLRQINSPNNHISIADCNGATVSNLHITAPETSPNTDGIDIARSTNIFIHDSEIGTGDDCIAINNGSSFINITRLNCGPGHGISIGSLGSKGSRGTVEEVHVNNCTFSGTTNGARIKTWQGGSGFARKISFEHITLDETKNPILIDQYYCPNSECPKQPSAVAISDVSFVDFQGTSETVAAIQLNCSETVGCTNVVLNQINITPGSDLRKMGTHQLDSTCINVNGRSVAPVNPTVSCLLKDSNPLHFQS